MRACVRASEFVLIAYIEHHQFTWGLTFAIKLYHLIDKIWIEHLFHGKWFAITKSFNKILHKWLNANNREYVYPHKEDQRKRK